MHILKSFWGVFVDALFPLADAERALASMSPEQALAELPPAPPYDGSVADLGLGMRSIFAYQDERASKLVWSIKYKRSAHAVKLGGYALYRSVAGTALIVPMPITERRRRERGYNQCELLIDEIRRLDMAGDVTHDTSGDAPRHAVSPLSFDADLLERIHHVSRQTLKSRADRLESAKGIFAVNEEAAARYDKGLPIVVIDDVITTGSTMKAALDALRAAGFTDVRGLSLAH